MQSCSVAWSKVRFLASLILKKLIAFVMHMARDMFHSEVHKMHSTKFVQGVYFNKNVCFQSMSDETKGVYYRHICASCWNIGGKAYSHSQADCSRSKAKNK